MTQLAETLDEAHNRKEEILHAAYELFAEKGLARTTMLAVAQKAKASKETLYSLFVSKEGLFSALIHYRMNQMAELTEEALQGLPPDPRAALEQTAHHVLTTLTMPSTIAVIRIALSESHQSPDLGKAFVEVGVKGVCGMIRPRLNECRRIGLIAYADQDENDLAEMFVAMFCGEWRPLMIIGQMEPPTEAQISARVKRALDILLKRLA